MKEGGERAGERGIYHYHKAASRGLGSLCKFEDALLATLPQKVPFIIIKKKNNINNKYIVVRITEVEREGR